MQGPKSTGLKAVVLSGLLLLSGTTSASFVEHSNHHVISEPKVINIPPSLRGHNPYHPHGSHGHRHRTRVYQKRAEGVVVEVPFTIWTGTFENLRGRSPKDEEDTKTKTPDTTSEDDVCDNVICPNGYYCTKDGCCPNGKKCTGVTTCIDASDSECPDNIACCPKGNPVCQVSSGQGLCMKEKKEDPTTTSEPPVPTPTRVTKAAVTTTEEPEPTSTTESETSTSTTSETTSSPTAETPTIPPAVPTPEPTPEPIPEQPVPTPDQVVPVPAPVGTDTISTTSAAPTPSTTAGSSEVSTTTKIISGSIAGSIVAIAFGSLIIYAIVQKRKEKALARAEEESKSAPLAGAAAAAAMGSGGNGRPLSIQPEPEMLHMAPQASGAVFASGPHQGHSLREGIPPPSPPPNAMVVGTPPYRRDQYRGETGTPTSLRAGIPSPLVPQQAQWSPPGSGYPQAFPFPEQPVPYVADGGFSPVEGYATSPGLQHTPSTGSYQAYSPPSTPRYPPGTAHSPR